MKTYEEREYIMDLTKIMALLQRSSETLDMAEVPSGMTESAIDIALNLQNKISQALSDCEKLLKEVL